MKNILLATTLALFCTQVQAAPKCHFMLDKSTEEIGWTAFKTSAKTAVNGVFKKVDVSGPGHADSLKKLIEGQTVTVHADSSDSANPDRNKSIQDNFFAKLTDVEITGQLKDVSEEKKTAQLELTFNGQKHEVPVTFEIGADDVLKATGSFDLLAFGAGAAYESLHKACEKLHTGPDGVSKTWSEVAVNMKAKITKMCK